MNNIPSHEAEFDQIEQEQTSPQHNPMRFVGAEPVKNFVCLVNVGGSFHMTEVSVRDHPPFFTYEPQPLMRDPTCRNQIELNKKG